MELLTIAFYLLLTLISLQALHSLVRGRSKTSRKLPPGPVGLPIFGDLFKLGNKPHMSLAKLAKTYGPIMTIKLGQRTTVVVSSPAMAKEVLQKQDLAFSINRTVPDIEYALEHYKYSMVWMPIADQWRSIRKILNSNIFSSNRLDANQYLRRQKVQQLISYVEKCSENGVAVDIGSALFTTTLNVLSNTIFSVDLADFSEDSSKGFKVLVSCILEESGKPNFADCFPALAKFDLQGIRGRITNHFGKTLQIFSQLIDQRLELRKSNKTGAENDVIDTLLNISEENNEELSRAHIEHLCLDLFVAGTDTTTVTMEWAMAELLRDPNILKKAKDELEQTIGKGKLIQESDVTSLPYLRAIVKETMRMHPPGTLLLPRKAEMDVEVCGYMVPKGTQVVVNEWAICHDPSIWPNPSSFMPERFLESKIDLRGRDFELTPFGAGRRICPGLPLSMRTIPVVVGSLINMFDWKLEGGIAPKELDMEERSDMGIILYKARPLLAVPFHA